MTTTDKPLIQGTEEWLEARKCRMTGSMIGTALGLNPYAKPAEAMRSMVRDFHGAEREFTGNDATDYGSAHEEKARDQYEETEDVFVQGSGFIQYEDWAGCSVDGLINDDGILEIKCPYGLRDDMNPEFKPLDEMPHYYAQVQWNLFVTGRQWCDFVQWNKHVIHIDRVMFSEAWLEKYLPAIKHFYELFLVERDNPDHLEPLVAIREDDEFGDIAEDYTEAKAATKAAKAIEDALKKKLIEACNGKSSKGFGVTVTKVGESSSIDYKAAVTALAPDSDLDSYRKIKKAYWSVR